jgi:hypothetical protein
MKDNGYPYHVVQTIKRIYIIPNIIINTGQIQTTELRTTQGDRQRCSLSPTLFNTYIIDLIKRGKIEVNPGIKISQRNSLYVLLFADDLTIIQKNENDVQRPVYKLERFGK